MDSKVIRVEVSESLIMEVISRLPHERSLKDILKDVGISAKRFFDYLLEHPRMDLAYSHSQFARAELLADEIIDIADTESDPQRARNRIDARKWVASKLKPNKFGDRIDLNVNHTVDLSKALSEARNRVGLRSIEHPAIESIVQPVNITQYIKRTESDKESVEQDNPMKSLDDIFS